MLLVYVKPSVKRSAHGLDWNWKKPEEPPDALALCARLALTSHVAKLTTLETLSFGQEGFGRSSVRRAISLFLKRSFLVRVELTLRCSSRPKELLLLKRLTLTLGLTFVELRDNLLITANSRGL